MLERWDLRVNVSLVWSSLEVSDVPEGLFHNFIAGDSLRDSVQLRLIALINHRLYLKFSYELKRKKKSK